MSTRKRKGLTPEQRRELDALAARILAGDEALEISILKQVYEQPVETELEPLPCRPVAEGQSQESESGA